MAALLPGEPIDESSTLGELYQLALRRSVDRLRGLLEQRLSVNTETLPDFYRLYFEFPWARVYTLNVDDLALAAERRFNLPRPLRAVSATDAEIDRARQGWPWSLRWCT